MKMAEEALLRIIGRIENLTSVEELANLLQEIEGMYVCEDDISFDDFGAFLAYAFYDIDDYYGPEETVKEVLRLIARKVEDLHYNLEKGLRVSLYEYKTEASL